jgi:hypothetical protein
MFWVLNVVGGDGKVRELVCAVLLLREEVRMDTGAGPRTADGGG